MIQVRNLRVDYDEVCAVRDLCLELGPGEIYGLIGPNGAGKTSTLRALVGLVEKTYGDIIVNGVDMDHDREKAVQAIGFMPDSAPLYDDLTVWEYLDLFAASYLVPRTERGEKITHYLELVDLAAKRNEYTGQLSRGMKQRLMLARTLLPGPQILLLDEPASGVDPYGRALLKEVLRQLGAEGRIVIISSHILPELSEFCTSVGIMERGSLVMSGRVEDVTTRVFGQGQIEMEVFSGADLVEGVLGSQSGVHTVVREGGTFRFLLEGGPEEMSAVLAELVQAGVRVSSFVRRQEDLEAVFLKVGAREVS